LETSTNGRDWQKAARRPVPSGALHGHAFPLDRPLEAQWVRIAFLDAAGKPVPVPCDEIELH
jgi:hypothetical protein